MGSSARPFALGLLVGLAVGSGLAILLFDGDDVTQPERRDVAFSPVGEPMAGTLAERFRPWLRFDSEERWRPVSISSLLAERGLEGPAHRFCTRLQQGQTCEPIAGEEGLESLAAENSALGAATFIDIAGERLAEYGAPGRECDVPRLLDCGEAPDSAIYYRVTSANGRFYVDYWWFLRFNHFGTTSFSCFAPSEACDEHEGDWEGVT